MRLIIVLLLILICISCKKEDKNFPIQEAFTTQSPPVQEERIVHYPDTTRYDSIKNNFSLTSRNFNENRIDFSLPNQLEDFQIQFSNIPNDRLKIEYVKKENTFFIGQEKTLYNSVKSKKLANLSIVLDSISVSFSVNGNASYISKNITPSKPYTVMTFSSKKQTMTQVVVSKNKSLD